MIGADFMRWEASTPECRRVAKRLITRFARQQAKRFTTIDWTPEPTQREYADAAAWYVQQRRQEEAHG
jgi:hypothetical protein